MLSPKFGLLPSCLGLIMFFLTQSKLVLTKLFPAARSVYFQYIFFKIKVLFIYSILPVGHVSVFGPSYTDTYYSSK